MTIFKLNDQYSAICEYKSTRNGFKHVAHLMSNGFEVEETKVCYFNRTWEPYTYQTVLSKLIETSQFLSPELKDEFSTKLRQR